MSLLAFKKQIFKFKNEDQKFCIDCHNNIHVGQFSPKFSGQACFQCHSTSTFKELRHFEHSKTSFALKGEHQEVDCIECHKPNNDRIKLKWPNFRSKNHSEIKTFNRGKYLFPEVKTKSCSTCHDDYHQGQLSKNCAECHTEKSWKSLQFNHNTQSRFKLVDKHEKVKCSECHKPTDDLVEYKNETRFLEDFKMSPGTYGNLKEKGTMTIEFLIEFAEAHRKSLDWLMRNIGQEDLPPDESKEPTN